mmetsp:Transcript_13543/g.43219  ORF Transcript_13543/g.43219 Transcript_13543/m.43219 type:complete len:270 (+) Transcript_13543:154-963(+)
MDEARRKPGRRPAARHSGGGTGSGYGTDLASVNPGRKRSRPTHDTIAWPSEVTSSWHAGSQSMPSTRPSSARSRTNGSTRVNRRTALSACRQVAGLGSCSSTASCIRRSALSSSVWRRSGCSSSIRRTWSGWMALKRAGSSSCSSKNAAHSGLSTASSSSVMACTSPWNSARLSELPMSALGLGPARRAALRRALPASADLTQRAVGPTEQGVIYVVDSADRDRFQDARNELRVILVDGQIKVSGERGRAVCRALAGCVRLRGAEPAWS